MPVGREEVAQAGAGQAVSTEPRWPLRPSIAFPGTGLCTQCLGLVFGSLGSPCWPCSSQFTLAVLSSACHLGTNRLHSLPQSLVSAAVLAHGPPACVQCFSLHVCAGVCVCAQVCVCAHACGTLPRFLRIY